MLLGFFIRGTLWALEFFFERCGDYTHAAGVNFEIVPQTPVGTNATIAYGSTKYFKTYIYF